MNNQFQRTESILGADSTARLKSCRVAVFGAGGVGGYAIEALARSGVGTIDIIDSDKVDITNLNRQIIATHNSVGRYKVDVIEERIHSICPDTTVNVYKGLYLPSSSSYATDHQNNSELRDNPEHHGNSDHQDVSDRHDTSDHNDNSDFHDKSDRHDNSDLHDKSDRHDNSDLHDKSDRHDNSDKKSHTPSVLTEKDFDFSAYDFIIDAIDNVTAKISLVCEADAAGTPIISAMGCGNRLDPSKLKETDIFKTQGDPLSKIMRKQLRRRGITKLKVVCSDEEPIKPNWTTKEPTNSNRIAEEQTNSSRIAEEQINSSRIAEEQTNSSRIAEEQTNSSRIAEEQNNSSRTTDSLQELSAPSIPENTAEKSTGKNPPGSSPFVPAAAGLMIASIVVRFLV